MYIVEYLIIVSSTNTKSLKALKNLLQSDVDITLTNDYLKYDGFNFKYRITTGQVSTGSKPVYFNLKFECSNEEEIPTFIKALKSVRGVLSLINRSQFVLWDDLSRYYSEKAYKKIFYIENLMRKLLTKFMFINLGMTWTEDRIPDEVKKSVNSNNKDINFLHNVDFIQLSKFLFSENYPSHKDSLIKKLNQAKNLDELNIEEIRSLLPESNWKRYFENLVECEGEYLNKRWEKLYELRNYVAHNRTFTVHDLEEVDTLTEELGEYLEDAINKLTEVVVPEDEIDDVVENVASERNAKIGEFIESYRSFENTLSNVFKQFENQNKKIAERFIPVQEKLRTISENISLSPETIKQLNDITKIRNLIVHGSNLEIAIENLNRPINELQRITESLTNFIQVDENYHVGKIKNNQIINKYYEIKEFLMKLSDVSVKYNKHYISFILARNFADIKLQQKSIKIWLNMPKKSLEDPENKAKDVSEIGHQGNGDYELLLYPDDNIEYIKQLLIQSHEFNKDK